MKNFIITIDTEGDNLWSWKEGEAITTKNVYSLQRFQDLCNKYNFKPVWLSNWEMLQNDDFVLFIKKQLEHSACELGMHLHAWNTPPIVPLPKCDTSGAPYLIEYPMEVMDEKIKSITDLINTKFGFTPISHRAGRWAMNDAYFQLLQKHGYKIDCSFTPGINWKNNYGQTPGFCGVDYSNVSQVPQMFNEILEVPVTTKITHNIFIPENKTPRNILRMFYRSVKGHTVWLRPDGNNLHEMLWLIDEYSKSEHDYLMFMLHSSELMHGGSPTFANEESIEILFKHLKIIFDKISGDYVGITLKDYYFLKRSHSNECCNAGNWI